MSDTKEYIIDKSYELFLTHSYEAVSISDISKAIDMTKGALYHHFLNKEELFKAVVDKHFTFPVTTLDIETITLKELLDKSIESMRTTINSCLSYSTEFSPINYISFLVDASRHYKGFIDSTDKHVKDEEKKMIVVLKNAIKRGEIRDDINVEVTAYTFTSLHLGLAGNLVSNTATVEESFSILKEQVLEYYKLLKKS
jgi:TetR/AcrR family transcriptional regulator, transcriptional repressor for nem operon